MPGNASFSGGIAELVLSAGPVAKFVLAVLALFSIICWALIVEKWWEVRKIRREPQRVVRVFREARRFAVVYAAAKKHRETPLGHTHLAGGQGTDTSLGGAGMVVRLLEEGDDGIGSELLEAANRAMRRAAGSEIERMERYLPFLATTASSAPFIGLFGTVWGIMTSFQN